MNLYRGRYTDVKPCRPLDWLLAPIGFVLLGNRFLVVRSKRSAQTSVFADIIWSHGIDCSVRIENARQ